ncbi:hypothetical protein T492DRAFT_1056213 [Pavlovales sp. CCMP2436]|nr:hypothetical protein T492DRAFT_1056213 [Pavlovales sp. CCMP2436]
MVPDTAKAHAAAERPAVLGVLGQGARARIHARLGRMDGARRVGDLPPECLVQMPWNLAVEPVFTRAYGVEEYGSLREGEGPAANEELPSCEQLRDEQNLAWAQESVRYGVSRAKEGLYAEALEAYGKALDLCPRHVDAFVGRGAAFANQSRLKEAVAEFDRAIAIDPEHKNALTYRGATLQKLQARSAQYHHTLPSSQMRAPCEFVPPPAALAAPVPWQLEVPPDATREADYLFEPRLPDGPEQFGPTAMADKRERREGGKRGKKEKSGRKSSGKKSKSSKKSKKCRRHSDESESDSTSDSGDGREATRPSPAEGEPSVPPGLSKRNLHRLAAGVSDTAGYDYV